MSISLFELTVGYAYKFEGNVQPLVDYIRNELKDEIAKDFIAKVLLGEIKKGDRRRNNKQSRKLWLVFIARRAYADFEEEQHGAEHISDDDIYAGLDKDFGYELSTAERMIKRYSARGKRKGDAIQKRRHLRIK